MSAGVEPLPCPVCGELPQVGGFALMDGRIGWTCLCPSRCHETDCWLDRDGAVGQWNAWAGDDEGEWEDEEWDE